MIVQPEAGGAEVRASGSADLENDLCVSLRVDGLRVATRYVYRFERGGAVLGNGLRATLDLQPHADFTNFMYLSVLNALAGVLVTNPAMPAVTTPLAAPFAEAAGWPLAAALMTIAVGYNLAILPYQIPPIVIGMHAGRIAAGTALRVMLPLAGLGIVVFMPLEYLWWRLIGYFG